MMLDAQIRPASQQDYPAICLLLESHQLPLAGVEHHLDRFVVAYTPDSNVAGVAGIESYGSVGLLRSVAVAQPNQGLGGRLVQHLLGVAHEAHFHQLVLLTTTAADYFPRFGFKVITRDQAPEAVKVSAEFQGACPDSAVVMAVDLREDGTTR